MSGPKKFAEHRAPRLIHRPDAHMAVCKEAVRAMAAINPAGYAQAVAMLASGRLKECAAKVQLPSLVLVGTEDQITPPAQNRATHEALVSAAPNLPHFYYQICDAGHLVHQEKPVEVAEHTIEFCGWNSLTATRVPA